MKVCSKCELPKTLDNFHSNGRGGLRAACKICRNKQNSRWRKLNRDKINEYTREWKRNNPDKVYANQKRYIDSNREKRRIYQNGYRARNRQRIRDQEFLRYHKNPHPRRESAQKYRRNNESHHGPCRIYRGELAWVEKDAAAESHEKELNHTIARMDWEMISSLLPDELLFHCNQFLIGDAEINGEVIAKIREVLSEHNIYEMRDCEGAKSKAPT